jgi:hypothetical protein
MTVDALWKAVSRLWRQLESLRAPRLWIRMEYEGTAADVD